ncbi:MAG TPA: VWA domain-containing protein [Bryobacteraceae bacterium]|nr:VWA domain-containing protein [Bryobacteraceae bacterium]
MNERLAAGLPVTNTSHERPQPIRGAIELLLAFASLFSLLGAAQAPTAPATQPDQNAAEVSSHEAPATFKSRVNLVLVPVVVRDSRGRAIGNLQKEDFQLFDKGKPQVISKFSIEKAGSQPAGEKQTSQANTPGAPAQPPLVVPDRFVAYLFDDIHLAFGDLARVRDAAGRNMDALAATDRAAIYSTSGQTVLDFTDDRAKLHETLLRLQPRPVARSAAPDCPDVSYYMADAIINKTDTQALQAEALEAIGCLGLDPTQPSSIQIARQAAQSSASRRLSAGEHESRLALNVVQNVVRRLAGMPGQRSVILVSPGFFTTFDLLSYKSEVIDRAIHSNVVINALDARGLYALVPGGDASQRSPFDNAMLGVRTQYQTVAASVDADVLAELADGTGGVFFHDSNDLDGGFKRAADRPEYLYVIGFSPQNLKLDGSFHKIKVAVREPPKLNVQARRGYYAPRHVADAEETAKQEIEEALFSREEMHELPVELHTQFFKPTSDDARISVLARVDLRQIRFRKEEGRNRNNLSVTSGLFDRNGNYITGAQKLIEMRLRDETLQNRLRSVITVKSSFDVKPGSYLVRLVVRDTEGQLMSAENGTVEIP